MNFDRRSSWFTILVFFCHICIKWPATFAGILQFGHNSISLLPTSKHIFPSRPLSASSTLTSKDEAKAAEADAAASKPEEGEATSASSEVEAQLKEQVFSYVHHLVLRDADRLSHFRLSSSSQSMTTSSTSTVAAWRRATT